MALTSANFYNPGFSNFPLSSLTENEDYFQIIWEVMGKNIGTCALMQDDILVALIKVKEKKNLMSLLLLTQWDGSLGN